MKMYAPASLTISNGCAVKPEETAERRHRARLKVLLWTLLAIGFVILLRNSLVAKCGEVSKEVANIIQSYKPVEAGIIKSYKNRVERAAPDNDDGVTTGGGTAGGAAAGGTEGGTAGRSPVGGTAGGGTEGGAAAGGTEGGTAGGGPIGGTAGVEGPVGGAAGGGSTEGGFETARATSDQDGVDTVATGAAGSQDQVLTMDGLPLGSPSPEAVMDKESGTPAPDEGGVDLGLAVALPIFLVFILIILGLAIFAFFRYQYIRWKCLKFCPCLNKQNSVKVNNSRSKFWLDTSFEQNGKAKNRESIDGISYKSLEISNPIELTSTSKTPDDSSKRLSINRKSPPVISAPLERSDSVPPPEISTPEIGITDHDASKLTLVSGYSTTEAEIHCALYPFKADDPSQISLQPGVEIEVVEKLDTGWWRGYIGAHSGWFPATYVEPVEPGEFNQGYETDTPGSVHAKRISLDLSEPSSPDGTGVSDHLMLYAGHHRGSSTPVSPNGPKSYTAVCIYKPNAPDELEVQPNDVLIHVNRDPNGWVKVKHSITGSEGWVPMACLKPNDEVPLPQMSPASNESTDWEQSDENLHNSSKADITGMEYRAVHTYNAQHEGDVSFRAGDSVIVFETNESGWWRGYVNDDEGWFPGSYVQIVPQSPISDDSGYMSPRRKQRLLFPEVKKDLSMVFEEEAEGATEATTDNAEEEKEDAEEDNAVHEEEDSDIKEVKIDTDPSIAGKEENKHESRPQTSKPGLPLRYVKPKMVKVQASNLSKKRKITKPKGPAPPPPLNVIIPLEEEEKILNTLANENRAESEVRDSSDSLSYKESESLEELTASAKKKKAMQSRINGHIDIEDGEYENKVTQESYEKTSSEPNLSLLDEINKSIPHSNLNGHNVKKDKAAVVGNISSLRSQMKTSKTKQKEVDPDEKAAQEEHVRKLLEDLQKSKPREYKPTSDSEAQVERFKVNRLSHRSSIEEKRIAPAIEDLSGLKETDVDEEESEDSNQEEEKNNSWMTRRDVPIAAIKPVGHAEEVQIENADEKDAILKELEEEDDSDLMSSILSELSSRDVLNGTNDSINSEEFSKGLSIEDINASFDKALEEGFSRDDEDDNQDDDNNDYNTDVVLELEPPPESKERVENKYRSDNSGVTVIRISDDVIAIDLKETDVDSIGESDLNEEEEREEKEFSTQHPNIKDKNPKELKLMIPPPDEFSDINGTPVLRRNGDSAYVFSPPTEFEDTPISTVSEEGRRLSGKRRPKLAPPPPPPGSTTSTPTGTLERRRSKGKAPPPPRPQSPPLSPSGDRPSTPEYTHPLADFNKTPSSDKSNPNTPPKKSVRFSPAAEKPAFMKLRWPLSKPKTPPKPVIKNNSTPYKLTHKDIEIIGSPPVHYSWKTEDMVVMAPPKRPPPPRPPPPKMSPEGSPTRTQPVLRRNNTDSQIGLGDVNSKKTALKRASASYTAVEEGELSFSANSFIKEIREAPDRPGWMIGMLADGSTGYYPIDSTQHDPTEEDDSQA